MRDLAQVNEVDSRLQAISVSIYRPRRIFYILSFVSLLVWLSLGPIAWRHIDDYGTFHHFLVNFDIIDDKTISIVNPDNFNFLSIFFKSLQDKYGFGTLPHSWHFIYITLSVPFIAINFELSRWIILILGFVSCLFISVLLTSVNSLVYLLSNKDINQENYNRFRIISDSISLILVTFNPEIMLHSSTYMPYQLACITPLLLINILASYHLNKRLANQDYLQFSLKRISIQSTYSILLLWFSILLGYQSLLALCVFIFVIVTSNITYLFPIKELNFKILINRLLGRLCVNQCLTFLLFSLPLLYLTRIYLIKFVNLSRSGIKNGFPFAYGKNLEYLTDLGQIGFFKAIFNLLHIISRLTSLAIYPFREFQSISSIICLFLLFLGYIILLRNNLLPKQITLYMIYLFFFVSLYSFTGKFLFAPTRHSIFLFPCIWIPFCFLLSRLSYVERCTKKYLISIILVSSYIFSLGLTSSHSAIDYTQYQKSKINDLASRSNIFPGSYSQYDWSLYWTHGNKEWLASKGKSCSVNKLDPNSKIFLFSHREPFLDNENQRAWLEQTSYGCLRSEYKLEKYDSFEFQRDTDIEVDSNIQNGGSGAYAYILQLAHK